MINWLYVYIHASMICVLSIQNLAQLQQYGLIMTECHFKVTIESIIKSFHCTMRQSVKTVTFNSKKAHKNYSGFA